MSFKFTDDVLDQLAQKKFDRHSWQVFVAELAKHELPACYDLEVLPDSEEDFQKKLDQIAFQRTVNASGDIIGTLLKLYETEITEAVFRPFVNAKKENLTIYQAIETWPKMLYR